MHTVFVDLETGGIDLQYPVIQLAAVAVRDWEIIDTFERKLVFDVAAADPEALRMNSYDPALWETDAVTQKRACMDFVDWVRNYLGVRMISQRTGKAYYVAQLAGYNAATFDGPRLQKLFKDNGVFLPCHPRVLDVMQLAMWTCSWDDRHLENFKLATVCKAFKVPLDGAHDALADVKATVAVARYLSVPAALGE